MGNETSEPFVIKLPNIKDHGDPFSCSSLFSFVQGHFHMPCAGVQVCIKVGSQTAEQNMIGFLKWCIIIFWRIT
jgi:hypothetical protein